MVLTSDEQSIISSQPIFLTVRRIGNVATTSIQAEKKKTMLALSTQPDVLSLQSTLANPKMKLQ